MKITNLYGISLPLAVWLMHDEYDYVADPNYVSATSLLKSTKQLILSSRIPMADREADLSDYIAARFGHAVHDSVERAWRLKSRDALLALGYPEGVVSRVRVNPSQEDLDNFPDTIPVYMERRASKEINGFKVSGKFDIVADGELFDLKTTSVYSYLKGGKDDDYALQGSLYRWLNPLLITGTNINIQFLFTDWQRAMTKSNPDYPKIKIVNHPVKLLSLEETERFIINKTNEIRKYRDKPEEEMPPCTDKELWRGEPQYKYYSDPAKVNDPTARSSKNFDNLSEANAHLADKGKGAIKTVPGEVKACAYCAAFPICKQKDQYIAE